MKNKAIVIASAFACVLLTLSFAPVVSAQGAGSLVDVLKTAASSEINGTVKVSEEKSPRAMGDDMALRGVGAMDGGPQLFTESLQINLNEGAMSASTSSSLPKIQIFRDGDKRLNSVTYSDEMVGVDATADAIAKALDLNALVEQIESAEEISEKDVDGAMQYRVAIDADYFKAEEKLKIGGVIERKKARIGQRNLGESVIASTLIATMDASGELKTLTVEAQYNDPMGGLIERAMKNRGRGGQARKEDFENSNTLGRKVIVTFTVTDDENSEAKAFATEAVELLGE